MWIALPSSRCLHATACAVSHWVELWTPVGLKSPKGELILQGPLKFVTGLQWPALWSFSSLLADDVFVKLLSPFLQLDNIQIMMAHLLYSLCARCKSRVTSDLFPKWSVSSLWTREYLHSRVLTFKFSPKSMFNKYRSTCPPGRQCRVRLLILCQQSKLIGLK